MFHVYSGIGARAYRDDQERARCGVARRDEPHGRGKSGDLVLGEGNGSSTIWGTWSSEFTTCSKVVPPTGGVDSSVV